MNSHSTSPSKASIDISSLYHEKQYLGHCAVHCLNNLLQSAWVDYNCLDKHVSELIDEYTESQNDSNSNDESIYQNLTSNISKLINTMNYKSIIPHYGSFDINCIIKALKSKQYVIIEHILTVSQLNHINLNQSNYIGLIVHINKRAYYIDNPHWFSVIRMCKDNDGKFCVWTGDDCRRGLPNDIALPHIDNVDSGTIDEGSAADADADTDPLNNATNHISVIDKVECFEFEADCMYVVLDSLNNHPIPYTMQELLIYLEKCITKWNGQIFMIGKE